VRLFLRLTSDINDRLRVLTRYRGDLSRFVDAALTSTDLGAVDLDCDRPGRGAPTLTAVVSGKANARIRSAAKQRGCTVTALANSALRQWLGERNG
jgi:hypothetical protein